MPSYELPSLEAGSLDLTSQIHVLIVRQHLSALEHALSEEPRFAHVHWDMSTLRSVKAELWLVPVCLGYYKVPGRQAPCMLAISGVDPSRIVADLPVTQMRLFGLTGLANAGYLGLGLLKGAFLLKTMAQALTIVFSIALFLMQFLGKRRWRRRIHAYDEIENSLYSEDAIVGALLGVILLWWLAFNYEKRSYRMERLTDPDAFIKLVSKVE